MKPHIVIPAPDSPSDVHPPMDISVVVPTLNEAANLPELAQRLHLALAGRRYELLVIDDNSTDNTRQVCAELATQFPLSLHVRLEPQDGLSGAVLYGFARANGRYLVVMDADLQHPPEKLPELLAVVESGQAPFALGSRYVTGGSTAGRWGWARRINSRVATLLAKPFAGTVRDPMSGFFCLARTTFDRAERLSPMGYKIALELICKCRVSEMGGVTEVPIHFDLRSQGQSKLTISQQFKYLEHLSRLYDFCFPRLSPMVKFLIASLLGWGVGLGVYEAAIWLNIQPGSAIPLAYLACLLSTAVFHFRYVRTQRKFLLTHTPWRDFAIVALGEFVACTGSAVYLLSRGWRLQSLELFALTFGAATIARYVLRKEFMQDIRGLRRELRAEP